MVMQIWDSYGGSFSTGFRMAESQQQASWFAVQIRSTREKLAATYLQNEGYECFLPLGKSRRRWSDRIKMLDVPLFPGYLFCRFNPHHRFPVLRAPGVIQIVGIAKAPAPIEDHEIAALQCLVKSGLPAQPWPFLQVGQTAWIEYGPLRGLSGIVVNIKSERKLVLSVTLLQRSVAVEIDGGWLSDTQPKGTAVLKTSTSSGRGQNSLVVRRRAYGTTQPACAEGSS
jgi:transcription antitermination factor NusG